MDMKLRPGNYVIAVSGGVDSMSLLHALAAQSDDKAYRFTVAHFDHGIRRDSIEDRKLVQEYAKQYNLPFVYEAGQLGAHASEEEARDARYVFLRSVMQACNAQAILTAHHKDDALETAVFNILRGTGRQGLAPLSSQADVQRPLIAYTKKDIYMYARSHQLQWREDETNQDNTFSRNYIRNQLLPSLSAQKLEPLDRSIAEVRTSNQAIDEALGELVNQQPKSGSLDRDFFVSLPHIVAKELLVYWLRKHGIRDFDRRGIERLTITIKTAGSGTRHDIVSSHILSLTPDEAMIITASEKKSPKK